MTIKELRDLINNPKLDKFENAEIYFNNIIDDTSKSIELYELNTELLGINNTLEFNIEMD